MKRAHPDALRTEAYYFVHSLPHLTGGAVGEGDGKYLIRLVDPLGDGIGDLAGYRAGLSRARTGKDQQVVVEVEYGRTLFLIQVIKVNQCEPPRDQGLAPS